MVVPITLTRLRRRSEASVLEDLEVLRELEGMVEEEGMDACLARSWGPGLGSPTLVAPPFNMAVCLLLTPGHSKRHNKRYRAT